MKTRHFHNKKAISRINEDVDKMILQLYKIRFTPGWLRPTLLGYSITQETIARGYAWEGKEGPYSAILLTREGYRRARNLTKTKTRKRRSKIGRKQSYTSHRFSTCRR